MNTNNDQRKARNLLNRDRISKIVAEYQQRLEDSQNPKFTTPYSSAAGYLRRKVYRLGQRLEQKASAGTARVKDGPGRGLDYNVFSAALSEIFEQLGKTAKGDRNRVRLIAHELEYAAKHNVPAKYLIGSIHQAGGSKGIEKLRAARTVARRRSSKRDVPLMRTPSKSGQRSAAHRRRRSRSTVGCFQTRGTRTRKGRGQRRHR